MSISRNPRPVYNPELGSYLASLRPRDWSQRQAGDIAKRRGLEALSDNVLLRLEAGKVKSPTPEHLHAIATLYAVPYEALVCDVTNIIFNTQLLPSQTAQPGVDSPAQEDNTRGTSSEDTSSAAVSSSNLVSVLEHLTRTLQGLSSSTPTPGPERSGPHAPRVTQNLQRDRGTHSRHHVRMKR